MKPEPAEHYATLLREHCDRAGADFGQLFFKLPSGELEHVEFSWKSSVSQNQKIKDCQRLIDLTGAPPVGLWPIKPGYHAQPFAEFAHDKNICLRLKEHEDRERNRMG
jgi:hypothetical protein